MDRKMEEKMCERKLGTYKCTLYSRYFILRKNKKMGIMIGNEFWFGKWKRVVNI
jgi:hypothetical protein